MFNKSSAQRATSEFGMNRSRFSVISEQNEISDEEALKRANQLTPEEQRKPYAHQTLVLNDRTSAKQVSWSSGRSVGKTAPVTQKEVVTKRHETAYVKPELTPHEDPVPVLFDGSGAKRERNPRGQGLFGRNARQRRKHSA
ncbi:hypothetical protein [Aeromonas veronii]|uniref:Uncharacterized protein n=1 Tax=Aeromonas veronii TaxID=654 RepID=A0A2T4MZN5_AERVE|nr:hypothetical protein [Aeromonas veronii]PTH80045.1 hypothetical protein DAA48_15895 [Aeromonas veronii]